MIQVRVKVLIFFSILCVFLILILYTNTFSINTNTGVSITSPSHNDKLAYDATELQFDASATADPSYQGPNIRWAITSAGVISATIQPTQGENVSITYPDYPHNNLDFGNKTVTAAMTYNSITYTDNVTVKIFFPPTEKLFYVDGQLTPNWFYYWNPVLGDVNAYYQQGNPYSAYAVYPAMYLYPYLYAPDTDIWVFSGAYSTTGQQQFITAGPTRTGIDFYANIIRHEVKHRSDYALFRQIQIDGYPQQKWDFNQYPPVAAGNNHYQYGVSIDEDNDDVPDSYENPNWSPPWPQTSKQRKRTWYNLHDLEFRAYYAETVAEDTNQNIDWTKDGKQW